MTTEWGALAGVFPVDEITISWLQNRANYISKRGLAGVPSDQDGDDDHPRLNGKNIQNLGNNIPVSDSDAYYAREIILDLSTVQPHVSGPNTVKVKTSLAEIGKKNINVNNPNIVVIDVSKIGLILFKPASNNVSLKEEYFPITWLTYSINIIALLTTIPANAITPIIDVAEK